MSIAVAKPLPAQWIRGRTFDSIFVIGTAAAALFAGALCTGRPDFERAVLVLNVWLLGYHHVASTFTRIAFDRVSLRENRFLVFGLPWLCIAGVGLVALVGGGPALVAVYFYWQAFHYTRQSYGISMRYARKQEPEATLDMCATKCVLYLLPLWGIVQRSNEGHRTFLGMELWMVPVPDAVCVLVGIVAVGAVVWWLAEQMQHARAGRLSPWYFAYMLTHIAVFGVGYLSIPDLDLGWLVINIWHNSQYILFVWLANHQQHGRRRDPDRPFLSWISQREKFSVYLLVCLTLSTAVYVGLGARSEVLVAGLIPFVLWGSMALNFHHYVVDGVIWKSRRRAGASS